MDDGIVLVDKPKGWTSFDVVAKIRGQIRAAQKQEMLGLSHLDAEQGVREQRTEPYSGTVKGVAQQDNEVMRQKPAGAASSAGRQGKAVRKVRVGHAGTLDPFATGLLIILLGEACKKADQFLKLDKTYEFTARLGETSTTGDPEGDLTPVSDTIPGQEAVLEALKSLTGQIMQVPPAFSAIKIDGKRAYKLAREGKEVQIPPRQVNIYRLELISYEYPFVKAVCDVSSGTYIRTLVEDIGKSLKTGAYCTELRRTKIGDYSIENASTIDKIL